MNHRNPTAHGICRVLVLSILVAPLASAQVKEEWRQPTFANYLVLDSENNICVDGFGQSGEFIAEKYRPDGTRIWKTVFGDPTVNEHVNWVAVDTKGAIILTGHKHGPAGGLMTVKFSADGAVLWSDVQNVTSGEAFRVDVDANDNVYVLGVTFDGLDNYDFYTVKYDSGGTVQWADQKTFATGSVDIPRALDVSPAGRVAVTGQVGSNDFGTVVYDTDGNELYSVVYLEGKGGASDVLIAPDDSVYICGMANPTIGAVVRYDANGNQLWARKVDGPDIWWARFNRLALDCSGNVIAAGYGNAPNSSFMDWLVSKIDPDGNLLWSATHGTYETWDEWALAVTTGPEDEVYVTGAAGTPGCGFNRGMGTVVIRYDIKGNIDWMHEAPCSGSRPNAIALDSFGEVVLDTGPGDIIRLVQEKWLTLGFELSGTQGDAILELQGYLEPNGAVELTIENALPFTTGFHIVGAARWDLPLAGGTLVPALGFPIPFQVDGAGDATISGPLPPSLPRPLELYLQSWFIDPGAPQGLAASNAVTKALQ